ncbi:uncharacterized protein [Branchiostoma lanceolatum]|uniref:uncharacterized protein n=1 Tax=Branchiostoma lanceolatum TaxID=7740 RepID=UPI003456CBEA
MLRICEKLRQVDSKARRLGLVRTETDYLRALLDAMANNMDMLVEVEVLKSLGDVNLEKGQKQKNLERFERAMILYKTALLRCEDLDIRESLEYRNLYAEKLRSQQLEQRSSSTKGQHTDKTVPSVAKVAKRFQHLDRRLNADYNKDSFLIEYTKVVIEGIVNGDTMLEVEAIKSLGDVHLKRGTVTRDSTCLTKATALYNTALSRFDGVQSTVTIVHRLLYAAKIRQQMKIGAEKVAKRRGKRKQQQQAHDPRGVTVPSENRDVTAGAMDQQVPSYEECLSTGDRALTDGKLDLAEQRFSSALKLIHDPNKPDRCKEAECLCRLGDVFLQRGKTTKEGRKFTQAAALYNAAMARRDRDEHRFLKVLQEIEQSFLKYTANVDRKSTPPDRVVHKKKLEDMRARVKSQLEVIDQQHDPYQYDEDDPAITTVEAKRAEAVKTLLKSIAKDRQGFIHDLVDECIDTLGPSPCKYAFVGLGSQATELVTPYSDLEFAILIEDGKDNDKTRQYFINLTHYLNMKVINLGETILPAMAIPSLNNFLSEDPEEDWFYDSVTPRGFSFDGFMPWASKTPFGRDQTKTKPSVSLIQTPTGMAEFQELDVSLAEGYHLSDILRRVVFLTGEELLVNEYTKLLGEIITNHRLSFFQSLLSATQILHENRHHFDSHEPTGELLNVKQDIYRFPGIVVEALALCSQITHASAWDIIDELKQTQGMNEENATHLTVLASISAELRLRTYMANGGQMDSMSPLPEIKHQPNAHKASEATLKSIFHIPDTKVLFRYYCRAIPLKKLKIIQDKEQIGVLQKCMYDNSNKCRARIAGNLFLLDKSILYSNAALAEDSNNVEDITESLNNLGISWDALGDQKKAIGYFEKSLAAMRSSYGNGSPHQDIAGTLHNLASSWSDLGDPKKAIRYYEQSLKMRKTIYGHNTAHPEIAGSLHNLGLSWYALGDYKKAISFYEQSLKMSKTVYGDNVAHTDVAASLTNLGLSWDELGDQKKAIIYIEQSLTMMKTIYGHNTAHPDIARSLQNLASPWKQLGDHKKAINYCEQSLRMWKTLYGDSGAHPGIAKALNNLGACWSVLGCLKKGMGYIEQSMAMMNKICGNDTVHPDVAMFLQSLGSSWQELGDHRKAISHYTQSLTMFKTIYGDTTAHPEIATSLVKLGSSWSQLGDHKKAISYLEQSLAMRKTIYGDDTAHATIATSLQNLGSFWSKLGNHIKAISYFEKSLTMRKTIYGSNTAHADIAGSLNNLGSYWNRLGDQKKAIHYYEQSLTMMKTIYGDDTPHPDIARSLENIGTSWSQLGNHEKAIKYCEHSLTMMKAIYVENMARPEMATLLSNLGLIWSKLGDQKKAIGYLEQSLTMMKNIHGKGTVHPDMAAILQNLGTSWLQLDNQKKAISYLEQSLTMTKTIYGDNVAHPQIAAATSDLGVCWRAHGDHKKAISYFEQALTIWKTMASYRDYVAHPHMAGLLYNLGSSWSALGDNRKAISYFEQSLTLRRAINGDNIAHPEITSSLDALGLSWSQLGDHKKAIGCYEQILTAYKAIYGDDTPHPTIITSLQNLVTCWKKLGDREKAISYLIELQRINVRQLVRK